MNPLWTNQTHKIGLSEKNIDSKIYFVVNFQTRTLDLQKAFAQPILIRDLIEKGKKLKSKQVPEFVEFNSGKLLVKF